MMRRNPRAAYAACVADLLADSAVQSMRRLPQHAPGVSCFHHCVLVSYTSFRICRALGLDARAAARGGLLHDLYLYNWRDRPVRASLRHLFTHPAAALRNAMDRFLLDWREADIIRSHMFPLTPTRAYHCWEALVVSTMDKLCAAAELFRLTSLFTGADRLAVPAARSEAGPALSRRAG